MSSSLLGYIDPGTVDLVVSGCGAAALWFLTGLAFLKWQARRILQALRRHRGASIGLGALLLIGGAAWALAGKPAAGQSVALTTTTGFDRVFLLGVDGTDPRTVRRLIDEGLMPNLEKLATGGALVDFAVTNPAESPVVWASLATGQNPGRHGVFDFISRDPETYLPKLALNSREGPDYVSPIRARAFWDVVSAHGLPTTLIRWPMTFPPPKVKGRVLAGLGVPDIRGALGHYTFFTDRPPEPHRPGAEKVTPVVVEDGVVRSSLRGPRAAALTGTRDLQTELIVRVAEDGKSAVIAVSGRSYAVEQGEWTQLAELTFEGPLFTTHKGLVRFHLQSGREPFALYATSIEPHPDAPPVAFTAPSSYASELKAKLGLFHTLGMPEDTKAVSEGHLSEAAFLSMCAEVERQRRAMLMYELGRFDKGVLAFVFDTPDRIQHMTPVPADLPTSPIGRYYIEFDRFLGTVLETLPEKTPVVLFSDHGFSTFERALDLNRWLAQQGYLKLDEEAWSQRKPGTHGELFAHVDWSKTRAYATGFASIYLNLEGREGQGIVPPARREALGREIAARLETLTDPRDGKRVVHRVRQRDEVYSGPYAEDAPDLVVGLSEGYRGSWQSAVGGIAEHVLSDNEERWQRDHIVDASFVPGVLVTNFPVHARAPHVHDLAPTVLSLLGLPVPPEMEGQPLQLQDRRARK